MSSDDPKIPVLIAGGGTCGAVAALAARAAGAEVLVLEQDAVARGSTAMSQGLVCAAGTKAQRRAGVEDSATLFFDDILAKTRGLTDPLLARAIADNAGPALDWLVERHDLPFELDIRFRAAYGHSVPRVHGWPGHGGEDLINLLHARLQTAGVDVLFQARLVDILPGEQGRAEGVVIGRPDGARETISCDALILATCGFSANHAMVAEHMPRAAAALHHGHEGNDGTGIRLGARLGGMLADMGAYQGYGMLTDPQRISVPPGVLIEGGILVDHAGRRFVNEMADIAGLMIPILARPQGLAWVIFDTETEQRCAHIPETQALMALHAARRGATAGELAARIGADPAVLEQSLRDAWEAAEAGRADLAGRVWGNDRPPSGTMLALRVGGALYHTQGGLQVDPAARVVRAGGGTLPNLFAGGGAARSVSGPSHWGYLPAMGLCTAVTLGWLAGRSAASQVLDRPVT
jgi:fumarate reductase flavoprotein subunit